MGVEEHGLFQLLDTKNTELVQQQYGCNFTKNSTAMPRTKKCMMRTSLLEVGAIIGFLF